MDSETLTINWGFISNPFKTYSAEHEKDPQPFFVEPPYFKDILGDLAAPTSSIVFGNRGEGKSTICRMVNYELTQIGKNKILIVLYTDFSEWDKKDIEELSIENHLNKILGLSVEKFIQEIEKDDSILDEFDTNNLSMLEWFILRFLPAADHQEVEKKLNTILDSLYRTKRIKRLGSKGFWRTKSYLRRKRVEFEKIGTESIHINIIKAILTLFSSPIEKNLRNETMQRLLARFRNLVISAGFSSIYILIDKADETEACSGNNNLIAKLVSPITTSLIFLETDKVATKLFLPIQVKETLGGRIRIDRILTRDIFWSDESLREMLKKRLLAYSDNKIDTLRGFVDSKIWDYFEKQLFFYAASSPRNLIRFMDIVIADLCELKQSPKLITKDAIDLGIKHFLNLRLLEDDAEDYQKRLQAKQEAFD